MNHADLHRTLIQVAQAHPPSAHVPYAFEQRIMARIRSRPAPDGWVWWNRALWRAAAPCLLLTVGLSIWSLVATPTTALDDGFETALDRTVLSAVDSSDLLW